MLKWVKDNIQLFGNAGAMMGSTLVTSGTGFVYWWFATRTYLPETVGLTSAGVAAIMLLTTFCLLGLGTWLISELPKNPQQAPRLISTAFLVSSIVTAVVSTIFIGLGGLVSADLAHFSASPAILILFLIGAILNTAFILADEILIAILKGHLQLMNNAIFAISKLVILVLLGLLFPDAPAIVVFTTWTLGNGLSLLVLLGLAVRNHVRIADCVPNLSLLKGAWKAIGSHHIINLTMQAPGFALPIIVTVLISAEVNAVFYVVWLLVNFLYLLPNALTMVLYAIGSHEEQSFIDKTRLSLMLSLGIAVVGIVAIGLLAEPMLTLFNTDYVMLGSSSLLIMAFGAVPLVLKMHYVTIARFNHDTQTAAIIATFTALAELVFASLGARLYGLDGLCLGYILGMSASMIYIIPYVLRNTRLHIPLAALRWLAILPIVLWVGISSQAQATTDETRKVTIPLEKIAYGDLNLSGNYIESDVWFPFDSRWRMDDDVHFGLQYVASPTLVEDLSVVTILANGREVMSMHPVADGTEHEFAFILPQSMLSEGGVLLTFRAYLRVSDAVCEGFNNPGQWMRFLGKSTITFETTVDENTPDLSQLTSTLFGGNIVDDVPSLAVIIPDEVDSDTLSSVAQIVAQLSNLYPDLTIDTLPLSDTNSRTLKDHHLLLIGEMDAFLENRLFKDTFEPLADLSRREGILHVTPSAIDENTIAMVITGHIANVARLFADQDTLDILLGDTLLINDKLEFPPSIVSDAWETDRTTFEQLGEGDIRILGNGVFERTLTFEYPHGWLFDESAQLALHVASSPALDAGQSYIDVFVNDAFAGTVETGQGLTDHWTTMPLPVFNLNYPKDGKRLHQLKIRFSVGNSADLQTCDYVDIRLLSTTIFADSIITTPHHWIEEPELQAFPFPFLQETKETETFIVLPDAPTQDEIKLGMSVVSMLGSYTPKVRGLQIRSTGELSDDELENSNLIILGTPDRQPLIERVTGDLDDIPQLGLYRAMNTDRIGYFATDFINDDLTATGIAIFGDTMDGLTTAVDALAANRPIVSSPGKMAVITVYVDANSEESEYTTVIIERDEDADT